MTCRKPPLRWYVFQFRELLPHQVRNASLAVVFFSSLRQVVFIDRIWCTCDKWSQVAEVKEEDTRSTFKALTCCHCSGDQPCRGVMTSSAPRHVQTINKSPPSRICTKLQTRAVTVCPVHTPVHTSHIQSSISRFFGYLCMFEALFWPIWVYIVYLHDLSQTEDTN